MDWQLWVVVLLVAISLGFLARAAWRTWAGTSGGCTGSCKCSDKDRADPSRNGHITLIPAEDLSLRSRGKNDP